MWPKLQFIWTDHRKWAETLSQDSSQMETPSWWVTLVFARWGCIKTRATWLPPCSSLGGTATLRTRGSWRTWAPTVQAGATLWMIMPHWTSTARGRTSRRVNWGPTPSGAAWCSTEEEGLWSIWGQIYKIPAGGLHSGATEIEWQMIGKQTPKQNNWVTKIIVSCSLLMIEVTNA